MQTNQYKINYLYFKDLHVHETDRKSAMYH